MRLLSSSPRNLSLSRLRAPGPSLTRPGAVSTPWSFFLPPWLHVLFVVRVDASLLPSSIPPAPPRLPRHLLRSWPLRALALALATFASYIAPAVSTARAAGDANTASCPSGTESSPGFRSSLPDCRAYEMVSPVYGGGAPAKLEAASLSGERIIVQSTTGFAQQEDLEGEIEGSYYSLMRTATGWTTESLSPPTSLFTRRLFLEFASADLGRTLYEGVPPTGAGEVTLPTGYRGYDLAVREATGGGAARFTVLGPMLYPGHEGAQSNTEGHYGDVVVGASADLSHVFFLLRSEEKDTWPGDDTTLGGQSLYEYPLAEGGEPRLVGVSEEGAVAGSPHVNDGAQLVSDCGTALAGVSGPGAAEETVYFTALHVDGCSARQPAVNELYARIDGVRTVKISGPESASFRGASEDGSSVFFTEQQRLYEWDASEEHATLIESGVVNVPVVSRDGTRVYFTSGQDLTVQPNGNGETAADVLGERLYVYDSQPGHTGLAFVAGEASQVQATRDGEYAMFVTSRDIPGTDDTSTVPQLFEYDAATRSIARVSAGQKSTAGYECPVTKALEPGYGCDGNTTDQGDIPNVQQFEPAVVESRYYGVLGLTAQPQGPATNRAIAQDGTVVFESPLALTPAATPGMENAYEYRAGQTYSLSPTLASVHGFQRPMIDESGTDVFFETPEGLVPQQTGTQSSIYDARIDGGFPAPPSPAGCAGERCQGSLSAPPAPASPLAAPAANENLSPPISVVKPAVKPRAKPCRRGFTRKHGRCLRVKAKRSDRAATDRRAGR